jgi:hypothetical protein
MWVVFGHSQTKVRWVDGGRTAERRCDECEKVTLFREGDVKDKLHVFFVELFATSQRRMICTRCSLI